jgi:hypothetical protein
MILLKYYEVNGFDAVLLPPGLTVENIIENSCNIIMHWIVYN